MRNVGAGSIEPLEQHDLGGVDQGVDPLDRVDATDEQDHALIRRDADLSARCGPRSGLEQLEVDAGRDRADFFGGHAHAPDEISALVRIGGDDAVGQCEQALFGAQAQVALAIGVRRDGVLHVRRGVKHLHEGCFPVAPRQLGGPARQPVVGVDDVIADALANGVERHLLGELGEEGEEVVLADRFRGTGGDGDHVHAGTELSDFWGIGIGATSEDIDRQPLLREMTGKLPDVDIHAPRVGAA